MSGHQMVIIVGHLGKDPEMRYTPSGTAVTSFSVATDRVYKKGEEKITETTWFRVSVWGKLAESCNDYLKKGSLIYAEGTLVPDSTGGPKIWEGQDGKPRANFELNCSVVQFLTSGGGKRREEADIGEEEPF